MISKQGRGGRAGSPPQHHRHDQGRRRGGAAPRLRETWPLSRGDGLRLLAAYVVLVGAFVAIGWPLRDSGTSGGVGGFDHEVSTWFVERRSTNVNTLTAIGSALADTVVKVVVTAIIVLVMLRVWRRWFEPVFVAVSLIFEALVFITVTNIVRRPRPDVPRLGHSNVETSFPSGHVAAAVVYVALTIVLFWHTRRTLWRALAVAGSVLVPFAVGVSRVQRGLHHLTDVIAGIVLGVVSLLVTHRIVVAAQARHDAEVIRSLEDPPHVRAPA